MAPHPASPVSRDQRLAIDYAAVIEWSRQLRVQARKAIARAVASRDRMVAGAVRCEVWWEKWQANRPRVRI